MLGNAAETLLVCGDNGGLIAPWPSAYIRGFSRRCSAAQLTGTIAGGGQRGIKVPYLFAIVCFSDQLGYEKVGHVQAGEELL